MGCCPICYIFNCLFICLLARSLTHSFTGMHQVEGAKRKRDGQTWSSKEQAEFKEKISSRYVSEEISGLAVTCNLHIFFASC